jgi:ABC-type Fe3+/spermidine/putrescine transport system ATPase subunit
VEIYERPVDVEAARLTGPASLLELIVRERRGDLVRVGVGDEALELPASTFGSRSAGPALALVRPEWARIGGALRGVVSQVSYRGAHTDVRLETPAGTLTVREPGPPAARPGEQVGWHLDRAWVVAAADGA